MQFLNIDTEQPRKHEVISSKTKIFVRSDQSASDTHWFNVVLQIILQKILSMESYASRVVYEFLAPYRPDVLSMHV